MSTCKCVCDGTGHCLTKWDCEKCKLVVCCSLVECRNYKNCKSKQPQWISNCYDSMCVKCFLQLGQHIYTNQVEECCVCFENKNMLILQCKHKFCNDCWFNITKTDLYKPTPCPLCRSYNK